MGPRFDSQKPRVSGAGARWPAGVLPLVSFDVGGAWWLFAWRHGRLQALQFRNFIGCYPRIEWSLLPLVFNTPPDWVASVTISLSLSLHDGREEEVEEVVQTTGQRLKSRRRAHTKGCETKGARHD